MTNQYDPTQPTTPPPAAPVPPAPAPVPKANGGFFKNRAVIGIGALIIGMVIGTTAAGGGKAATSTPATQPMTAVTVTVSAEPEDTDDPGATAEPTEEATTDAPAPEKKSYKSLSTRQFKRLAKDPDSYIGKTYIVYGEVTQFDSATGTDTFRADTGGKKLRISYGYVNYDQNSILTGDEKKLKKLVEGDCFSAKVTVLGSYSYDTQAGGNTTVPMFEVDGFSIYGSTD